MAVLESAPRITTSIGLDFYGAITWTYHKDLSKMQNFYNDHLGYTMVADQGWTKIYQTSPTGFIGLVDERRGMENYADSKSVEIQWKVANLGFDEYADEHWQNINFKDHQFIGPEQYSYHIR